MEMYSRHGGLVVECVDEMTRPILDRGMVNMEEVWFVEVQEEV